MLRFSTSGESHGEALVALLSGMPAGLKVDEEFVNRELWRRQQGYGRGGRMRIERDTAQSLRAPPRQALGSMPLRLGPRTAAARGHRCRPEPAP